MTATQRKELETSFKKFLVRMMIFLAFCLIINFILSLFWTPAKKYSEQQEARKTTLLKR